MRHLVWIGPLVVASGAVSYFLIFARWPELRDFPWLNLPWVLAGVGLSAAAWRRKLGRAGLALSALLALLFCAYVFVISYQLPGPAAVTAALAVAPDFTLSDSTGRQVSLAGFRGRKVLLVFYRGHW